MVSLVLLVSVVHCLELFSPPTLCYKVNPVLLCFPMVHYVVHHVLGLKFMQELGVEEM